MVDAPGASGSICTDATSSSPTMTDWSAIGAPRYIGSALTTSCVTRSVLDGPAWSTASSTAAIVMVRQTLQSVLVNVSGAIVCRRAPAWKTTWTSLVGRDVR